jgi:hypothetical protein
LPLIEEAKKEVVATMVLKKFVVKPSPSLSQSDPSRRRATLLLTLPPPLQETAKSTRAKTLVDKDQALVDKLSTRVLALVDKMS